MTGSLITDTHTRVITEGALSGLLEFLASVHHQGAVQNTSNVSISISGTGLLHSHLSCHHHFFVEGDLARHQETNTTLHNFLFYSFMY